MKIDKDSHRSTVPAVATPSGECRLMRLPGVHHCSGPSPTHPTPGRSLLSEGSRCTSEMRVRPLMECNGDGAELVELGARERRQIELSAIEEQELEEQLSSKLADVSSRGVPLVKFIYRRTHGWTSLSAGAAAGSGRTFVGPLRKTALTIAPAARMAAPTANATVNPCTSPSSARLVP